ncbi:hypothetical protein M413DRAFT_24289 [Hebeloma cylindrosporum]|uniref:Retrotransposon gag domain-containing protein n=1 Tax=Hebeloma cylindrosporum TaxID=76867 RepID=A0A0C3C857_HEBCY|nr:hypothetical protein M413DRAFT_24289 [Hebeloma cylindrosporum h7]
MPSPEPMAQDLPPSNEERIRHLEETISDLRSQGDDIKTLLQQVLDRLSPPAPVPTRLPLVRTFSCSGHSAPTPPTSPHIPPSVGRKKAILKPSNPTDFDGDHTRGKAFLTSCRTYIRLCPESFLDEITKIIWAMSFMKTGRASRWAERELESEVQEGSLRFIDWLDFEEEFQKDFTPQNAKATAVNILETTSYFQGRRWSVVCDTPAPVRYQDLWADHVPYRRYTHMFVATLHRNTTAFPASSEPATSSGPTTTARASPYGDDVKGGE